MTAAHRSAKLATELHRPEECDDRDKVNKLCLGEIGKQTCQETLPIEDHRPQSVKVKEEWRHEDGRMGYVAVFFEAVGGKQNNTEAGCCGKQVHLGLTIKLWSKVKPFSHQICKPCRIDFQTSRGTGSLR